MNRLYPSILNSVITFKNLILIILLTLSIFLISACAKSNVAKEYSFEEICDFNISDINSLMLTQSDGSRLYIDDLDEINTLTGLLVESSFSLTSEDVIKDSQSISLSVEIYETSGTRIINILVSDTYLCIDNTFYKITNVVDDKSLTNYFMLKFSERFDINKNANSINMSDMLNISPKDLSKIEIVNCLTGNTISFVSEQKIQEICDVIDNLSIEQLDESPLLDSKMSEAAQNCSVFRFYLKNEDFKFHPYCVFEENWITIGSDYWYKINNNNYDYFVFLKLITD